MAAVWSEAGVAAWELGEYLAMLAGGALLGAIAWLGTEYSESCSGGGSSGVG